jgi:DNA-directed RNA polymerase subunit RPC12/RpoP
MSKIQCPYCGSAKAQELASKHVSHLTMGPSFEYNFRSYKCSSCSEEFEADKENHDSFLAAEKTAQGIAVKNILDSITAKGISMAQFERAFELPQRTCSRWKSGDVSSTTLALLRTVVTYPWIIKVAECGFEPAFAQREVVEQCAASIGQFMSANNIEIRAEQIERGITFSVTATKPKSTSVTAVVETPKLLAVGG